MALFKSSKSEGQIASLDLKPASTPANPARQPGNGALLPDPASPKFTPPAEEVSRRTKLLFDSGQLPANIFLLAANGSVAVYKTPDGAHNAVLLFSSPFRAADYARAQGLQFPVATFKLEALPVAAKQWHDAGIDSFFFDCCPRCAGANLLSSKVEDKTITTNQVAYAWATAVSIRNWRAEDAIRRFLAIQGDDAIALKRRSMEFFRDHIDCGIPYVHWLIAIFAGIQQDEPARLAAVARLEEFGPAFKGIITRMTDRSQLAAWGEASTKAHAGLLATFGMFKETPQPPAAPPTIN
jgi:hypothetical protein